MRLALILLAACGAHAATPPVDPVMAALMALSPAQLPPPPADATNRFADDTRAVALGQRFFFTTVFSGPLLDGDNDGSEMTVGRKGQTQRVSCASCHVAADGFSDTRSPSHQTSLATGWGLRRAPSLLDVGQTTLLMWDGRHDSMFSQVFGPFESAVEMNSSRLFVAQQVYAGFKSEYEEIFGAMPPLQDASRFGALSAEQTGCQPLRGLVQAPCNGTWRGSPGDHAEYDALSAADQDAVTRVVVNVGKAIGAYERTLSCGQGRFDAWVHGDTTAMNESEQRGARLFVGDAQCVSCHSGPFFSDQAFHNVGLSVGEVASVFLDKGDHGALVGLAAAQADPLRSSGAYSDGDDGRLDVTVGAAMDGAFRTPMLRCVSSRPSFFHTAQVRSLEEAVGFFSTGGNGKDFTGTSEVHALDLSKQQQADLVAFLGALDGPGPADSLLH